MKTWLWFGVLGVAAVLLTVGGAATIHILIDAAQLGWRLGA